MEKIEAKTYNKKSKKTDEQLKGLKKSTIKH